jgi:SAM-dependent methyltransferase
MTHEEFSRQFITFREQSAADGRFAPIREDWFQILNDDGDQTVHISWDYWAHVSWAARKIAARKPSRHIDFGSYFYFAGICSAFVRDFIFADIRPMTSPFPNLRTFSADLTHIPVLADNAEESLSCLHTLEHIGLGRYGDALDPAGDRKAAAELSRILAPGGQLLIVVPMEDPPRVCFNAHRLYSYPQVLELFPKLQLEEFSLITNEAQFFENVGPDAMIGRKYACGCWRFTK